MSQIEVVKSHDAPERELNLLGSQIREKAYERFVRRGGAPGHELEDWLCAEKDHLYRPPAEMAETGSEVRLCIAVSGFYPEHMRVTVDPDVITVEGKPFFREREAGEKSIFSEFRNRPLLRRFELQSPIDPNHVTAAMTDGLLWVLARKEKGGAAPIPEAQGAAA
jgi:HSP20 family molecular chaperone IbpA